MVVVSAGGGGGGGLTRVRKLTMVRFDACDELSCVGVGVTA